MVAGRPSASSGKKRSRNSNTRDVEDEEEEEEEENSEDEEQVGSSNKKNKSKGKKGALSKGKGKKKALEEEEEEGSNGEDEDDVGKPGALTIEERDQLVQNITRYVLFCEYTRKPIKREDISKAFLTADKRGRHFPDLILRAQKNLQQVFGMELVLMRTKEGVKNPAKNFALRSTLPLELIKASTSTSFPDLIDEEDRIAAGMKGMWKEVAKYQKQDNGVMRDTSKEQGGAYGILGVILGLILVNGKVLGDDQLLSYLRRLGLEYEGIIPSNISSSHPMTVSAYLSLLVRESYLEKTKTPGVAKQGVVSSKAAGEVGVEWRWGPRAEIEIGETGIASFLQTIYEGHVEEDDEDDEEVDDAARAAAALGKKNKAKKLTMEIKRAANAKNLLSPDDLDPIKAGN